MLAVNVLVTGAEGFAGRVLAEGLRARGEQVRAVVAPDAPAAVRTRFERAGIVVHVVRCDDEEALVQAARGVDAVVHVAPDQRLRGSIAHHERCMLIPAEATLAAAQRAGAGRLVLISSESVSAGTTARGYVDEAVPHASRHASAFAEVMALTEALVTAASGVRGTDTVVLRPGLLWGPDDSEYLPEWLRAARGRTLTLVGRGNALFTSTFTANLVTGVHSALVASAAVGRIYHLTDDERITSTQFFTRVLAALGLPRPRRHVPYALAYASAWIAERMGREPERSCGDVVRFGQNTQFNLQRAREDLQYDPLRTGVGIQCLVAWVALAGGLEVLAKGEVADVSSVLETPV